MAGTVATLTGCVCGQLPRLLNAITTVRPSGTRSLLCCLPKNIPQPVSSKPRKGAFFSSSLSFPNFDSWVHGSILFAPLLKMLFSTADFCLLCARKGNFPHSLVLSSPPFLYHTFTNLFTFVRPFSSRYPKSSLSQMGSSRPQGNLLQPHLCLLDISIQLPLTSQGPTEILPPPGSLP